MSMKDDCVKEQPGWYNGQCLDEVGFCCDFITRYPMVCVGGKFFSNEGRIHDENGIKKQIYEMLRPYLKSGLAKKCSNLLEMLRMEAYRESLPVHEDRLHVAKLVALLSDVKLTNYKDKTAQVVAFLEKYIPDVAAMETQMKKYEKYFKTVDAKQKALESENEKLTADLKKSQQESTLKRLQEARLQNDYERAKGILDRIPPEIIRAYTHGTKNKEVHHYSGLE